MINDNSSAQCKNPHSHHYKTLMLCIHQTIATETLCSACAQQAYIDYLLKLLCHYGIFRLDTIFDITEGFNPHQLESLLAKHPKFRHDLRHHQMMMETMQQGDDNLATLSNIILHQRMRTSVEQLTQSTQ